MGKNYGTKKRDWHIVHTQSYSLHPLKTYVHTHAHRHLHFSFPFSFVLSSTPSYFDLTLWHHSRRSEMELEVVHVKARCAAQQHNQNAWKKKSDGRRKKKKKKEKVERKEKRSLWLHISPWPHLRSSRGGMRRGGERVTADSDKVSSPTSAKRDAGKVLLDQCKAILVYPSA